MKAENRKLKDKDAILNQPYMSAKDLKMLMPTMGIDICRNFIDEIRAEMKEKKLFVPETKPRIALTKMVRKKTGI